MTTHLDIIGPLFAHPSTGDLVDVETFRRSSPGPYSWSGEYSVWWDLPDEVLSWTVVLHDVRYYRYGDQDTEAMDETNLDAVLSVVEDVDEVPSLPTTSVLTHDEVRERVWTEWEDEVLSVGAAWIGRVLVLSPDREDELDEVRSCLRSLADYPLLDEDAYSSREWDAWLEYAPEAFRDEVHYAYRDEDASVVDRIQSAILPRIVREDDEDDEWDDVADYLLDREDEVLSIVAGHLHYSYGFSGEYGPSFLSILADLVETHEDAKYVGQDAKRLREVLDLVDTGPGGPDEVPGQERLPVSP